MASNNGYLTEELAWVTPKFHGLIIGTKTGIRSELKSLSTETDLKNVLLRDTDIKERLHGE